MCGPRVPRIAWLHDRRSRSREQPNLSQVCDREFLRSYYSREGQCYDFLCSSLKASTQHFGDSRGLRCRRRCFTKLQPLRTGREDVSRVLDLSLGGLFLKRRLYREIGTPVKIDFLVQEEPIRADAVVRHPAPDRGLGPRFTALTEQDRSRLAELMRRVRTAECQPTELRKSP